MNKNLTLFSFRFHHFSFSSVIDRDDKSLLQKSYLSLLSKTEFYLLLHKTK